MQYRVGEREKDLCPGGSGLGQVFAGEVDKHSIFQCFPGGDSRGIKK